MSSVQFRDTETSLVMALQDTAEALQDERITLRQLLELAGEQGLLLFCIFLVLPFMFPVSIPGVSTVFGLVIILIGVGVTMNRMPWFPQRLMQREVEREQLLAIIDRGIGFFTRLERWVKPRLTRGAVINQINGLSLTLAGILLIFPLSFIPFSNTLPALAILFMAFGMLQRDGYFIIAGYLMNVVTIIYFGALALITILGGQAILS
jgi:hypothetical protein